MQNILDRDNNNNVMDLCTEDFAEQISEIKADDNGVTPMETFSGNKTDITLKNHHTWGCAVYVLYAILQGNIYAFPK